MLLQKIPPIVCLIINLNISILEYKVKLFKIIILFE